MKDAIPLFAGLLFPPTCIFCERLSSEGIDICETCLADMPFIKQACRHCALPLTGRRMSLDCGRCLQQPPSYDRAISIFEYRDAARELVTMLKFNARLPVARTLGELMWQAVRGQSMPDALLPVPLHGNRLRERGFNQSTLIADMLARHTDCAVWRSNVLRVKDTAAQSGLDAAQRRSNIKDAFAVTGPLHARHVAIIDDVITTGSTVEELARLLKRERVEKVSVWSVARAPLDK